MRTLLIGLAFIFGLAGCAELGLSTPETFNQKLAASIATVTALRQSALTLLQAKKITPDDAQNVQAQADNARVGIEIARSIGRIDPKSGEDKLAAVRAGLVALQAYLVAKGGT